MYVLGLEAVCAERPLDLLLARLPCLGTGDHGETPRPQLLQLSLRRLQPLFMLSSLLFPGMSITTEITGIIILRLRNRA